MLYTPYRFEEERRWQRRSKENSYTKWFLGCSLTPDITLREGKSVLYVAPGLNKSVRPNKTSIYRALFIFPSCLWKEPL